MSDNDTEQPAEQQAERSNSPASQPVQPIPPEPAVPSVYVTGASVHIDDDGMVRVEWLEMNAGKLYSRGAIRMTLANFASLPKFIDVCLQKFHKRIQAKAAEAAEKQAEQTSPTTSEVGHA